MLLVACHPLLVALLAAGAPPPSAPDALVEVSALPGDEAVRRAWADATAVEPYAAEWVPTWNHPVPKDVIAATLGRSLETLRQAAGREGAGVEVRLAAGVAARWAHNLDVKDADGAGFAILEEAARRFPGDVRPEWYLGASLCQTLRSADGMARLLAAEARAGARRLPARYWRDALRCASVTAMPAHADRAGRVLEKLGPVTDLERQVIERARSVLRTPALDAELAPGEAWSAREDGDAVRITSRPCGFVARIARDADVGASPVKDGMCALQADLGKFPGRGGAMVVPSILVMARRQRPGESLDAFVASIRSAADGAPLALPGCAVPACRALEVHRADGYPEQGGALFVVKAFERPEPEIRGLALERAAPPQNTKSDEVQFFRLEERYVRFPGKMFYMVVLDTADSVKAPALEAYQRFLEDLVVE